MISSSVVMTSPLVVVVVGDIDKFYDLNVFDMCGQGNERRKLAYEAHAIIGVHTPSLTAKVVKCRNDLVIPIIENELGVDLSNHIPYAKEPFTIDRDSLAMFILHVSGES